MLRNKFTLFLLILLYIQWIHIASQDDIPRIPMDDNQIKQLREEVKEMFYHAYDNYMKYAFPKDELKPLSCTGHDTWGGYSLTMVDALDTLVIMGNYSEFSKNVKWIIDNLHFHRDVNVSVFETNIRVVGGLLSAHLLASDKEMNIMPSYKGELLPKIVDLVDRLLPAFDTPTGIPYGTVNLMYGVPKNEVQITSTAGAGTNLLEFGILSILTGNDTYINVARQAARALYQHRSSLDLVGNHINIYTGKWTVRDSGVGAGIDSFFEYLFKGYMLFGDEEYIQMFNTCYTGIMKHVYRRPWYIEVDMMTGVQVWPIFNSLQAFWPGIQALFGHVSQARDTTLTFHSVWRRYGCIPEGFNIAAGEVQPGQRGYPLRPEHPESIYTLYRITHDPLYLYLGRDVVRSLQHITRVECGFANVANVESHSLADRMESFFLAETLKYLYLLFDEYNFVNGVDPQYTFNTEGHIIPLRKEFLSKNIMSGDNVTLSITDTQCKFSELSYFSQNQLGVCELFSEKN